MEGVPRHPKIKIVKAMIVIMRAHYFKKNGNVCLETIKLKIHPIVGKTRILREAAWSNGYHRLSFMVFSK